MLQYRRCSFISLFICIIYGVEVLKVNCLTETPRLAIHFDQQGTGSSVCMTLPKYYQVFGELSEASQMDLSDAARMSRVSEESLVDTISRGRLFRQCGREGHSSTESPSWFVNWDKNSVPVDSGTGEVKEEKKMRGNYREWVGHSVPILLVAQCNYCSIWGWQFMNSSEWNFI